MGWLLRFLVSTTKILIKAFLLDSPFGSAYNLHRADPPLHRRFDALANEFGLDGIELYTVNEDLPNAIPIGHRVIITSGLIERLDDETLDVVLSHSLAHIKLGHDRSIAVAGIGLIGVVLVILLWPLSSSRRGLLLTAILGMGGALISARSRRCVETADRVVVDHLDSPEPLARTIIALQTGQLNIDPSTYSPPRQSRLHRMMGFYPPTGRRLSTILEAEISSSGVRESD